MMSLLSRVTAQHTLNALTVNLIKNQASLVNDDDVAAKPHQLLTRLFSSAMGC